MTHEQKFRELQARFLRLRNDEVTDADGDLQCRHIAALAAQAVKLGLDAGVLERHPDVGHLVVHMDGGDQPTTEWPDPRDDDAVWAMRWDSVCRVIGPSYGLWRPVRRQPGIKVSVQSTRDWRQRCEDGAAVCAALADAAAGKRTTKPRIDPPEPDSTRTMPMTAQGAADITGWSVSTIRRKIRDHELDVTDEGAGKWRFLRSEIDDLKKQKTEQKRRRSPKGS